MKSSKIIKILITSFLIILMVFLFDLIINILLPESLKKKIGTTRNYSLKSIKFHHEIAPNIDVYEHWGKKKYKVVTNEYSMRVLNKDKGIINNSKKNIGFIGDSFVYGSGINYKKHFINILNEKNNSYNFLNLGYVSYSPSIHYKRLKYFLQIQNLKFDKIFLFVDHSDVQDEGVFYRENSKGNIVRKWYSDEVIANKNKKNFIKNYFKQNSFIYKFFEHFNSPKISEKAKKCILDNEIDHIIFFEPPLFKSKKNYIKYLDVERFGYGYMDEIKDKKWVDEGINKILNYLDKILLLSKKYNFELHIVYYPSAMEILNKIHFSTSKHFIFLNEWSLNNNINFINIYNQFNKYGDEKSNYLKNFIKCDVHWNDLGHFKISKVLESFIND